MKTTAAVVTLAAALAASNVIAQQDSCQLTANDVLTSCQNAAQSDYQLALANCDNVSKRGAQKTCRQTAAEDLAAAQQTCTDQSNARVAACQRFGPAPYDPVIKPSNFVSGVNNPYFPLPPGTIYVYEGQTVDGFEHDEFAVTHNTRTILGVTCVEVHDTVLTDGVLTEDTLDWFAQDKDGNVWYFGENTHELEDGLITTIDGTFMAGVDSAKPGIVMKAHPAIGDFYRQEFSLANAEDYAETLSLNETVTAGGRTYTNCLQSEETTPLETDLLEFKYYAPGVGNVLEVDGITGDRLELVEIRTNSE
ncbi:MAG: hypothetical protein ABR514_00680 [Chthoniobacterales bacterium]